MRLTVIGCAGSFPGPDSAASSYLVEADAPDASTTRVLLDLGSGALGPLQRFIPPLALDAVLISHLHPDHCADLCGLYVMQQYAPDAAGHDPIPVYAPPGAEERCAQMYGHESDGIAAAFDFHIWQPGALVQIGPLQVIPVPMLHVVECFGMRITGPSEKGGSEGGEVTLAYTGDTDDCPGADTLAADVDLLIAEAAFLEGRDDASRGIHLTGARAGDIAARNRAQSLLLTHIPAWNPPDAAASEAATRYDGPIATARAGMQIQLRAFG